MGLPARDAPFLKERLDGLREAFGPPFLGTDPLGMVHRYRRGEDREAAAFFAAALAFGRVAGIRESLRRLLDRLGERPAERLKEWPAGKKENPLRGIVHRWVGPEALHALAGLLGAAFRNRGSLESLFLEGYAPAAPTLNGALARFRRRLLAMGDGTLPREGTADERALRYLLPDPSGGSACKRLHLFLRWMIRPDDGVDLGLWSGPRTDQLTIPLDTHIARIGRLIGLTDRSSPDRKAAEEITDSLRLLDPADPVRYDFSLSRLGILGHCPRRRDDRLCRGCPLRPLCRHWRRPAGRN